MNTDLSVEKTKIALIGLGYVGLPLAVSFSEFFEVIGFDINANRINKLKKGKDDTLEVSEEDIKKASLLSFTNSKNDIKYCNCFIITVPTPVDKSNKPDFQPLFNATFLVASVLKKNDTVIYESTVYPGATEELCVPILEKHSQLSINKNFYVGYSPERINPGDKTHKLKDIIKITSGSNTKTANFVDNLYKTIITAGTYKANSIKVAEAAKVIENTQRDLNIALINELAIIFNKIGLDTQQVLEAAKTKWNFLNFVPGLVGGHCIGVDPYYLTYKAEEVGYYPQVILAGRRINEDMGAYVANQLVLKMLERRISIFDSKVLILGLTFKENCPDIRNTRVIDVVHALKEYGAEVDVFDPWVKTKQVEEIFGLELCDQPASREYDSIIISVAHNEFLEMGINKIKGFLKNKNGVIFDLKSVFNIADSDLRL